MIDGLVCEGKNAAELIRNENCINQSCSSSKILSVSVHASRDQNSGKSHNIKIDNSFFERVEQFKYLGTTLTYQNSITEEIKRRLMSGNACYHSVQNLLSFSLLTKNLKIKIYKITILRIVLYGCETWSHTLREEHRLRVFGNRVLRRIFGP